MKWQTPYKIPDALRDKVEQELQNMLVTLASHDGQQCCELALDRHVWTLT